MKVKRQIIRIDEELCDGCELCIPACPEGALQIVDGVAKVVKEGFCDGLGACLGECPQGALTIEEKEVDEYDEEGVIEHLKKNAPDRLDDHMQHLREHGMAPPGVGGALAHEAPGEMKTKLPGGGGCPSARLMQWGVENAGEAATAGGGAAAPASLASELRQWPIQLHLVNPIAPYFKDADLVLVADCVPFAYANFHDDFLKGKAVAIACPKLDDTRPYIAKLTQMIDLANLKSMKVVVMEVPCCSGLVGMAREAVASAKRSVPLEYVVIGIKGGVKGQAS
jgi:NAD-dependent dihydropyrimidine dehydrogenase PreA subunit